MCCSALGQIVYGILMAAALGLTLVGIFTPGWRKIGDAPSSAEQQIRDEHKVPSGLFPMGCKDWLGGDGTTMSPADCDNWWHVSYHFGVDRTLWSIIRLINWYNLGILFQDMPTWNKVVIVSTALAVIAELLALAWNLLTFCACCCKRHLLHPLTGLAVLTSIFLAITVIIFGVNNKDSICDFTKHGKATDCEAGKTDANYSFYLIIAALACSLVSIGVGIIASCFANHSLWNNSFKFN